MFLTFLIAYAVGAIVMAFTYMKFENCKNPNDPNDKFGYFLATVIIGLIWPVVTGVWVIDAIDSFIKSSL